VAKIKSGCPANQNIQKYIMNKMYRPLPDNVTIKNSPINGLGLFATEDIPQNTLIGKIHIPNEREPDGYFRTPLGGFGNHSDNPNCTKLEMKDETWYIMANQKIDAGDEITWSYTLYEIT
jgi:SET domain-containing protein